MEALRLTLEELLERGNKHNGWVVGKEFSRRRTVLDEEMEHYYDEDFCVELRVKPGMIKVVTENGCTGVKEITRCDTVKEAIEEYVEAAKGDEVMVGMRMGSVLAGRPISYGITSGATEDTEEWYGKVADFFMKMDNLGIGRPKGKMTKSARKTVGEE